MRIEELPDNLVYFSLRSFTPPKDWNAFVVQADQALARDTTGAILDLRSNFLPNDFAGAVQLSGLVLPPGTLLFSMRTANGDPQPFMSHAEAQRSERIFTGPIIVLIDHKTAGAAEALAAALQAHGAVTMGGTTSGNGALFASRVLASGRVLSYVSGEITMGNGQPLWRHAVQPDVGIPVDQKKAALALDLLDQGHLSELVQESPGSHRLSESALVQGYDPELDAYLPLPGNGPSGSASPLQDSVLVAALDSLRAIRLSHAAPAAYSSPGGAPVGTPR